ncbi:phosphoglycerate kinase [Halanaerobiaceae bacterium Z-7014]|uniref:Phosphoglycerate kinase n=1 Tax=Halonatronomonas betaini TaxID=2778430 RepID=A0A931ANU5_9FIRM|nr:phosphoglycerate kinase [Halonatronomonas betaini]MBF8435752.1 phosphoglycerate kinase [Halonatronomonas betaini]
MKKALKDFDFKNKKVLVRVDFNVPLDGDQVTDDTRIEAALPTIRFLMNEDAKVILMSHLGRPGGKVVKEYKLDPVADRLADLLGKEVYKTDESIGREVEEAIEKMDDGDVLLLENTRFHPGEKGNDPEYAKALAGLADVFVNDAFGAAHRAHASTTGVAEHLPAIAGFLIQRELEALGRATDNPEKPYTAIIGGAKVSDKMDVIKNIIPRADYLLLGGGIANTFLLAKGLEVGDSLVEEDRVELAKEIMDEAAVKGIEVILPEDVVVAKEFKADSEYKVVDVKQVPKGWQILDSGGPKTLEKYKDIIKKSKTVTWNGPIGVFEMDQFAKGTMELAKALAESDAYSVVGGGESAAAIKKAGVESDISHVSTGGGASLQFFEGKPLPGIEALDDLEE